MKAKFTYRGVVMQQAPKPVTPAAPVAKGPAKVRVGREVAGRGGKGVTVITGLPLAAPALAGLTAWQWTVMLSTGLTGALGHFLQIMAYRRAPASLLAPFIYLQITGATAWGWLIWGQLPDALTWVGIVVICSCGVVSSLIEWHRARSR